MTHPNDIPHEVRHLRLLAAALDLQHLTSLAANVVPIPSRDRVIAIARWPRCLVLQRRRTDLGFVTWRVGHIKNRRGQAHQGVTIGVTLQIDIAKPQHPCGSPKIVR